MDLFLKSWMRFPSIEIDERVDSYREKLILAVVALVVPEEHFVACLLEDGGHHGFLIPHLAIALVVEGKDVLLHLRGGVVGCYHVGEDDEVATVALFNEAWGGVE